jgi:plasmid replication initiation protein
MKDAIVKKANIMIDKARYSLSIEEQRFLLIIMGKIKVEDTYLTNYSIPVSEIMEKTESKHKDLYYDIKNIGRALQEHPLLFEEKKEEGTKELTIIPWLSYFHYLEGSGTVEVGFNERIKTYLLQLKGNFTTYNLKYVLPMRSSYHVRLYELLKQKEFFGKRYFDLQNFKDLLMLNTKGYRNFNSIKTRIILASIQEIAKNTDLQFVRPLEIKKEGNKVVGFTIYFSLKPSIKKELEYEISNSNN